jgi:hypothetical protein
VVPPGPARAQRAIETAAWPARASAGSGTKLAEDLVMIGSRWSTMVEMSGWLTSYSSATSSWAWFWRLLSNVTVCECQLPPDGLFRLFALGRILYPVEHVE